MAEQRKAISTIEERTGRAPEPTPDRPLGCEKPNSPAYRRVDGTTLPDKPQKPSAVPGPSATAPAVAASEMLDLTGLAEIRDVLRTGNATLERLATAVDQLRTAPAGSVTSGDVGDKIAPSVQTLVAGGVVPAPAPSSARELAWINFDRSLSSLTDAARQRTLDTIPDLAAAPDRVVIVAGYADRTGSPARNMRLARERARAVANVLITEGNIPADRIDARGYGEAEGPVVTADDISEPLNRSVAIILGAASGEAAITDDARKSAAILETSTTVASGTNPGH